METSSLLALFDDIQNNCRILVNGGAELQFYRYLQLFEQYQEKCSRTVDEMQLLQQELNFNILKLANSESKLSHVRKLLEVESKSRRQAELQRDAFKTGISYILEVIRNEDDITDETRYKFDHLNEKIKKRMTTGLESDYTKSTGSILSDLSSTQFEDDFLEKSINGWKKYRPSKTTKQINEDFKKMRMNNNDKVQATFQVQQNSTPKSCAPEQNQSNNNSLWVSDAKPHLFVSRTFLKTNSCCCCWNKIRFGTVALKCRICSVIVHTDCSNNVHAFCAEQSSRLNIEPKEAIGFIEDYSPTVCPMVPALIVHCLNEIETRDLNEAGFFRISRAKRVIKALNESFLCEKQVPNISYIDVHVLYGCVIDFLNSLQECLIPPTMCQYFIKSVEIVDKEERTQRLISLVEKLPPANRDTLAFLMMHFQRIANIPQMKMSNAMIANMFGPTIVGPSSPNPEQQTMAEENVQFMILRDLLHISKNYWAKFVNI